MTTDLLKVKNHLKKKKPIFRRVEKHRHKQLPDNWRKPKGHHSKIRRGKRWEMKMPKIGRSTPVALKHTNKLGKKIILIQKADDFKMMNNNCVAVLSRKLGLKKKAELAKIAKAKGYTFTNIKIDDLMKKAQAKLEVKKKVKEAKPEVKEKAAETLIEKPVKPVKPAKPEKGETK